MSPLPRFDRLPEYGVKGIHLGLREVGMAPEHLAARRLHREWQASPVAPGGTRALFLTPRDWAVHVQWEALMAQALRLRGAEVSFLTCGGGLEICDRVNTYEGPPVPCHTCTRYVNTSLDAHGFDRRSIREFWAGDDGSWPELDGMELDALLVLEDGGLPLGQLVAIPVRWFLLRSALDDEPLAALTARRFLRSARRVGRALEGALDTLQPDVVCVLNGLFFFESIALALCRRRGTRTFCYERGFIPGTIITHRENPDQLLDVSEWWPDARHRPLRAAEEARLEAYRADRRAGRRTMDQYWSKGTRHDAQIGSTAGRLAVLFTNLTWDSAVLGQEVAFASIHDWITASIEWFAAHPEHRLVVRVHPAELKLAGKQTREPLGTFIEERFPILPDNVEVLPAGDPTSSYVLMEQCDLGLVFTSTTGLELALAGKAVIVAGETHYRGKGFTADATSATDFAALLEKVIADPAAFSPNPELVARYANLFFFDAPITIAGVEEPEIGLARLTIRRLGDLAPGSDPDIDRLCDLILAAPATVPPVDPRVGTAPQGRGKVGAEPEPGKDG